MSWSPRLDQKKKVSGKLTLTSLCFRLQTQCDQPPHVPTAMPPHHLVKDHEILYLSLLSHMLGIDPRALTMPGAQVHSTTLLTFQLQTPPFKKCLGYLRSIVHINLKIILTVSKKMSLVLW